MAFDDYQIRYSPLSSDEVFAAMIEYQRQTSAEQMQERRLPLTRQSELWEWENACDWDDFALNRKTINRIVGSNLSIEQWKALKRLKRWTLGEFCAWIAPFTSMPRIESVTVLGAESRAAGAFLLIRRLMADAGAPVHEVTPASDLAPHLMMRDDVLWKLCCAAPGRIPQPRRVGTSLANLAAVFILFAVGTTLIGLALHSHRLEASGLAYFMLAIFSACMFGLENKPPEIRFGWLKTFRDLSRAMAGEAWGAWRGFPMALTK